MKAPHLILGIGELLWDVLPEGPLLGGAPANFTVMAGRLGDHAVILSRIGRDELGRNAVNILDPLPVDSGHLQVDPVHETGRVTVTLKDGQPEYIIHQPAAWDFLELSDEWLQMAERADAFRQFGSGDGTDFRKLPVKFEESIVSMVPLLSESRAPRNNGSPA